MPPTAPAQERIGRLTGRGRTDDRGGGLPLTDLFGPILRTLLDEGLQPVDVLTAAVRGGFIGRKEDRLQYIYDQADPWSAVMDDALSQLESVGLVMADGARWELTGKFRPDKPLVVIRGARGELAVKVTVASDATRAAREGETTAMYITELATELDPRRGGLRPLDMKRVGMLVESMRAFGFRKGPGYAIVKDQHGRVLDGRHRIAAAEKLGIDWDNRLYVQVVKVDSDQEALAWTFTENVAQADWSTTDLARITRALGGIAPAEALSDYVKVRNVLLDHAGRIANKEVHRLVGVSPSTVAARRAELEAEGALQPYDPEAEKRAAIRAKIERDPDATDHAVGKELGVSQNTVKAERESVDLQAVQSGRLEGPEPDLRSAPSKPVVSPKKLTKGQLIDRELLANPDRTDEEIASLHGASPSSVWRRRKKFAGQDPYNGTIEGPRATAVEPELEQPRRLELTDPQDVEGSVAALANFFGDPNVLCAVGNGLAKLGEQRGGGE